MNERYNGSVPSHRFRIFKWSLPFIVLLSGAVGAWVIVAHGPEATPNVSPDEPPLVQIVHVEPRTVQMNVHSQGTVVPRAEIELISEVSGRVIAISPFFAVGAEFTAGEKLVVIDPRDYELAVVRAQASVAGTYKTLLQEQFEAQQARDDRDVSNPTPTDFALRKPHLKEAQAKFAAAQAELKAAQLNLERTTLYAPFAGRVREKKVDVGQYVTQSSLLARLYAVDAAEVRLPIASDQLQYLDLPLASQDIRLGRAGPHVVFTARFAGQMHQWEGRIVRTDGALDEKTGMFHAIAQVQDPYTHHPGRVPLTVGLFVQAEIAGRERRDVYVLPPTALHRVHQVLVMDGEQRVRFRDVEVLRHERDQILVSGDLNPGDAVIIAGLDTPVAGMTVRIQPHGTGSEEIMK